MPVGILKGKVMSFSLPRSFALILMHIMLYIKGLVEE